MLRRGWRLVKRVFRPRIVRRIVTAGTREPRHARIESHSRVYHFQGGADQLWEQVGAVKTELFAGFETDDRILIKINMNTADPYPASTDPATLGRLLQLLTSLKFTNLWVGDCSAITALPTRRVFRKTGIAAVVNRLATPVYFDEEAWVEVPIRGEYWKNVVVPQRIFDFDRIIYLANIKTHCLADFSLGVKLGVGMVHPKQRYDLHGLHLQEKIAETLLAVEPDLIFLDARKVFITGGPARGETASGDSLIVGQDPLAVDLAGYRLLYQLKNEAGCGGDFQEDPFEMRQFKHLAKILGREAHP